MKLCDRISGAEVDLPKSPCLFGRWLFSGSAHLNGGPVESGDVLVPGAPGHWALVRPGDTTPVRGQFHAEGVPDGQLADALLELDRMLFDIDAPHTWLDWSDQSPLAPGLEKALTPHPLEEHIERELGHLREVCHNPRTHIRHETERVLVSRARKISSSAPRWLSAHTEDWSHRTIVGVQPRRILAEVREEKWELYENRLAVRLIDHLVAWLRQRIAELRRVHEGIFAPLEALGSSTNVSTASRHRIHRLFRLLGRAWDEHQRVAARVNRAIERLERPLYALLGLIDSPLYRHVSRHAQVPRTLTMTNLLNNDQHYRGVARLWVRWSQLVVPRMPSAVEQSERNQRIHQAFVRWSVLLVVRACEQIGLSPEDDAGLEQRLRPGAQVKLVNGHILTWERMGAITLSRNEQTLIRLVPLVHAIDGLGTREALQACTSTLRESVSTAEHWTVILHPAVLDGRGWTEIAAVANPPMLGIRGAMDFVRVSPFVLDSVERVARAIRWATLAPAFLVYPPKLEVADGLLESAGPWLHAREHRTHVLLRAPLPAELARLDLDERLRRARDELDRLSRKREDIGAEIDRSRGDRRLLGELNRQKRELGRPLDDARRRVDQLAAASQQLERGLAYFAVLTRCPLCGESGQLEVHDGDCFEARCGLSSCEAVWGLRGSSDTGLRVPFLLPGSIAPEHWPDDVAPQWVDEELGCDVLAIPRFERGVVVFRSPRTTAI